jgi:pyrroline-5-carboxylate reductase
MNLCIVGCGNMGLIYAQFLLEGNWVKKENLLLIEKNEDRRNELRLKNIGIVETPNCSKFNEADLILLAVKPQDFNDLSIHLKGKVKPGAVVISIMAGITINHIKQNLKHQHIVRAMPNAPALYGKGMTVFSMSNGLNEIQKNQVKEFISLTGKILETDKEDLLDAVTALSGSGPAYFFYLAQQMIEAATHLGMNAEMAEILVKQTLVGAAEMLDKSSKKTAELIKTVASKGGTTEAALNHFNSTFVNENIIKGIEKATLRSKELSGEVLTNN